MRLSVVIPCYNAVDTLPAQLAALAEQKWDEPWEVIVVDDGSTDGSSELARRFADHFEHFRVVETGGVGISGARNAGAEAARSEYLAFCDADDVVTDGWVRAIGEAVGTHDFVAGPLDTSRINSPDVIDGANSSKEPVLSKFGYLPHAHAACLAIRKEIHDRVQGFDPDFAAGEDADYCWRVQRAGTPLRGAPQAVIHYRNRTNFVSLYRQAVSRAVADVQLHKRYDPLGMPRIRLWSGVKGWMRLALSLSQVHTRRGRLRVARQLGYRIGRIRGAIRFRYPAL